MCSIAQSETRSSKSSTAKAAAPASGTRVPGLRNASRAARATRCPSIGQGASCPHPLPFSSVPQPAMSNKTETTAGGSAGAILRDDILLTLMRRSFLWHQHDRAAPDYYRPRTYGGCREIRAKSPQMHDRMKAKQASSSGGSGKRSLRSLPMVSGHTQTLSASRRLPLPPSRDRWRRSAWHPTNKRRLRAKSQPSRATSVDLTLRSCIIDCRTGGPS